MLQITMAALDALAQLLEDENAAPEQAVRLVYDPSEGLTSTIGVLEPGDAVVHRGDRLVLILNPALAEALDGQTLDVVEGEDGLQLMIQ